MTNCLPEKVKFKQEIADVTLGPWIVKQVLDKNGDRMPFFEGPRTLSMIRIKRRIEKQKPCKVAWHLVDGAEKLFEQGFDGKDSEVYY